MCCIFCQINNKIIVLTANSLASSIASSAKVKLTLLRDSEIDTVFHAALLKGI